MPQQPPSPSASLRWGAPITNTDGTPLTDLVGYNVYDYLLPASYATATVTFIPYTGQSTTECTFYFAESQRGVRHYFSVTAINKATIESDHSNEVSKTL